MVTIKSQGTVDKNKVKIPHIIAFCTTKTNAESYYDYFFSRVIMIKMGLKKHYAMFSKTKIGKENMISSILIQKERHIRKTQL